MSPSPLPLIVLSCGSCVGLPGTLLLNALPWPAGEGKSGWRMDEGVQGHRRCVSTDSDRRVGRGLLLIHRSGVQGITNRLCKQVISFSRACAG